MMMMTDTLHEMQTRRDDVERTVDRALRDWIAVEHRRTWPDQGRRDAYFAAFEKFIAWCRENDLDGLPSTGHIVALHLLKLHKSGATLPQIRLASRAVIFYHHLHGRHLDELPINAALSFAKATLHK
jgi:hypothetical protein